jgi:hypothetical protein
MNKKVLTGLFVAYLLGLTIFCIVQHETLFAWPGGIVTGNLLASAIWAPLAVIHLDRLAIKHHRAHLSLLKKQHKEQLDKMQEHHETQLAAITGGASDQQAGS